VGCETVSAELPLLVDGSLRATPAVAEHLRACLACQAEQAGYRRLLRALRALGSDTVPPAPGLLASTVNTLHGQPVPNARKFGRAPAPGALAVAGMAAAGVGVLVVWAVRRPRALAG
jgi:hypothetical protein